MWMEWVQGGLEGARLVRWTDEIGGINGLMGEQVTSSLQSVNRACIIMPSLGDAVTLEERNCAEGEK